MSEPNQRPAPAATAAGHDPYAVLRDRNVRLYLLARLVASFGQQMLTVAVGWELYDRTHSTLALGFVGLSYLVPMLVLTVPAGHCADTYNRKRLVVWMTGLLALASLGLMLASWFRAPTGWTYACLVLAGAARSFLWPASASFLPQLVPRELFPRAVAWSTGSFHLSSVAGPAAGGALIALTHHAATVYALNALAGLLCVFLIGAVAYRQPEAAQREPMTFASLGAGFEFVWRNRIILGTITLDMFAVLLGGATALLPVYAKDILQVGPAGLGWLQAALPVGSLTCSLLIAHLPPMQRAGRTLLWAVIGFGLATVGFGWSRWFALSWLMLFVCGATDNVSMVVRHTLVQLLTPDEKRGRVSAVNSLFIGTSNELGGFESGLVAYWFGPVVSVVSGGIGTILVVLAVAWIWPEIRRYGRLEGPS